MDVLGEFNGGPAAVIVGRRERLDALNAAFVNSLSSGALAFNDTHYRSVAHPTSPVAAALLALAERQRLSGEAFVHALILGDEIQCRIGNVLVTPPAESSVGLSMAGLVGTIGAAVAAGKAMNFDEAQMTTAIGLAANQSAGLRESHGTMASQFTQGHAARCGLMAALLARRGYTCTPSMLEGPKGFAASFATGANLDAATVGLGETFEIADLAYKPYPSGFVVHPIIDACLDIVQAHRFDTGRIERVELTVNPLALQLCNRPAPKTRNQLLVSLQHWAAAALVERAAGLEQTREALVGDATIAGLRAKVVTTASVEMGREAACAVVVLNDGRRLEATVPRCRGSEGRPLTDDDISAKTLGQLRIAYDGAKAAALLAASWRIGEYPEVAALCAMLGVART